MRRSRYPALLIVIAATALVNALLPGPASAADPKIEIRSVSIDPKFGNWRNKDTGRTLSLYVAGISFRINVKGDHSLTHLRVYVFNKKNVVNGRYVPEPPTAFEQFKSTTGLFDSFKDRTFKGKTPHIITFPTADTTHKVDFAVVVIGVEGFVTADYGPKKKGIAINNFDFPERGLVEVK